MLKQLRKLLQLTIDNIDAGNTDLSEEDTVKIIDALSRINDSGMSKYQAYTYLNISRASFDNMVADGLIPQGKKIVGFKELRWYKADLDKLITNRK